MITTTTEIKHFQNSLELVNEIELDDLETIANTEFVQGLLSDTEFSIH